MTMLPTLLGLGSAASAANIGGATLGAAAPAAAGGLSSMLGPLALLGGGLASGIGSLVGGASQNRAARQARDYSEARTGAGNITLGSLFYGPQYGQLYSDMLNATQQAQREEGVAPGTWENLGNRLNKLTGGPISQQLRDIQTGVGRANDSILNRYDTDTGQLSRDASQRLGSTVAGVDNQTNRLSALAQMYGQDRERQIRGDAERDRQALDARTAAQMAASGFNSTLQANQMAQNASEVNRARDAALTDAGNARLDRVLNVGQQGLNLRTNAMQSGNEQQTGNDYQRAADRTGLRERNLGRYFGTAQDRLATTLSFQQSPVLNPYLGANTTQYYPGASGVGNALTNLGGLGVSYGAYTMGQQNQQNRLAQLQAGYAL